MAVPLLTAWWHCGSRLLQTSTAQAFVVFSLLPFLCFLWVWVISLTDWRLIWKQNFTKQILASSKSPFFYFRVTEDPVASNDISSFNLQRNRWFLTFCTWVDVRCFQVHDKKALSAPGKLQWFAWCVGEQKTMRWLPSPSHLYERVYLCNHYRREHWDKSLHVHKKTLFS